MKKKHELLKHAYDNYPKGTHCEDVNGNPFFTVANYYFDGESIRDNNNNAVYNGLFWAEIPGLNQPKPSLLSGRVAIQVSNEREFKLLMGHYESKGWKWSGKEPVLPISELTHSQMSVYKYNTNVMYQDEFLFNVADKASWKIIPFTTFASEVSIKVPVFVMRSQDGVDLYEGDESWVPQIGTGKYTHVRSFPVRTQSKTDKSHRFATREAAEKWIAEQNKPTYKHVDLFASGTFAHVYPGEIILHSGVAKITLSPSDL